MKHIRDHVEPGTEIHTDEHGGYNPLDRTDDYKRLSVVHADEEYVGEYGQTTNSVEGFFSQLKRTINWNAHQRFAQAPEQIREGMRVPAQSSGESGVHAAGVDFSVP